MKFSVAIDGAEGTLNLLAPAPACRFQWDEGPERTADVAVLEPGAYSILVDGCSYQVRVEETQEGLAVFVGGRRFAVEIADPRSWARKSAAGLGEGVQTIRAPMPGKVVRVLVAAGDAVEAGQGLLVVEAMKMQNEMRAPRGGTMLTVTAVEGATVVAGETLATIG